MQLKWLPIRATVLPLLLSHLPCPAQAIGNLAIDSLAGQLAGVAMAGEPGLVLSADYKIDIESAYRIQSVAVRQRINDREPDGFKAGLTSTAAQQKFSFMQPVSGVLLPGSRLKQQQQRYRIDRQGFNRLMLEAEFGFRMAEVITARVDSIESLKTKVAAVLPVVELPDLAVNQPGHLQGVDIITNNVMARVYIAGDDQVVGRLDLNNIRVTVERSGAVILQASGSDAMGDQWRALLWLVNRTIDSGWQIQPGQLLITGALGKMLPASPAGYRVDYGPLGQIDFTID